MAQQILSACITALLLFGAVVILLTRHEVAKRDTLPEKGEILYDGTLANADPLIAGAFGLAGKPSYVEQIGNKLEVILLRPGNAPAAISYSDVALLAAELFTVEEALGARPTAAALRYENKELRLPYTRSVYKIAVETLEAMRNSETKGPELRSQYPAVCAVCAYKSMCAVGKNMLNTKQKSSVGR